MIRLATIIDTFGKAFMARYGSRLSPEHRRALTAIQHCRSRHSLMLCAQCSVCDHQRLVPHSCGNRHCPHCQHHESEQWLQRQRQRLVPADYFLITFTVPEPWRALAQSHPAIVYETLLRASWETVRTFARNDKKLGGTAGAIAVLHTQTRRLAYHPHVHLVVPAATIDAKDRQWRRKPHGAKGSYLFNHKALAKVFRAKCFAAIEAASLPLPRETQPDWVVDCKAVGSGDKALVYLGHYLYRGVIREKDIVACDDKQVTFRYRNAKTERMEKRTLPGEQFLWLVMQHVLPKGFRRARNFGFLHPNCKRLIALIQIVLKLNPVPTATWFKPRAPFICPCCGAEMIIVRTRIKPNAMEGTTMPLGSSGAH